jgi:hypothetical protein
MLVISNVASRTDECRELNIALWARFGGDSGLSVLAIDDNGEARPDLVGGTVTGLKLLVGAVSRSIIKLAGELDDRWLGCASGWAGGKSGHPFARAKETLGCKA